jgi:hypothetical protein
MCVPGCREVVMSRLSRQRFMLGAGGTAIHGPGFALEGRAPDALWSTARVRT